MSGVRLVRGNISLLMVIFSYSGVSIGGCRGKFWLQSHRERGLSHKGVSFLLLGSNFF